MGIRDLCGVLVMFTLPELLPRHASGDPELLLRHAAGDPSPAVGTVSGARLAV